MPGNSSKQNLIAGIRKAFAFETVTVTASSTALTTATYTTDGEKAKRAVLTLETGQIRYRYDGTAPTASVGHILNVFDILVINSSDNISNFRAIRTGGTSGVLSCTYEN